MSNAQALPRLSTPQAAPATRHHDDTTVARGLMNGLLLSVPLWGLIVLALTAIF